MQAWADLISGGRNRNHRPRAGSEIRERWALRIVDDELFLRDAIQALGFQDLGFHKAVIKNTESTAQHNLGRRVPASNTPGKAKARRPVCVILNPGLSFEAKAVAESDIGAHLPIVLVVKPSIEIAHHQGWTAHRISQLSRDGRSRVSGVLNRG